MLRAAADACSRRCSCVQSTQTTIASRLRLRYQHLLMGLNLASTCVCERVCVYVCDVCAITVIMCSELIISRKRVMVSQGVAAICSVARLSLSQRESDTLLTSPPHSLTHSLSPYVTVYGLIYSLAQRVPCLKFNPGQIRGDASVDARLFRVTASL